MVMAKVINAIPHWHIQTHLEQKFQGNILHFHQLLSKKIPEPLQNMIHGFLYIKWGLKVAFQEKNGTFLFESISCFIDDWKGKPFQLQLKSISWAQKQVSQGTSWGMSMWIKLDKTKANIDCYNQNSYMEYLDFMKTAKVLVLNMT